MAAKLAVFKLASCDGCQLTLLDCEDELLALAGEVEIAHFPEASSAIAPGPYDLSLVEGSITTPEDAERVHTIRADSRHLVTIGACATMRRHPGAAQLRGRGGVPTHGLRPPRVHLHTGHLHPRVNPCGRRLRAARLPGRAAAAHRGDHGVPEAGRKPDVPDHSVCFECKRRGTVCVTVAHGTPASARSRTPDAGRCARPTTAAASAASARPAR